MADVFVSYATEDRDRVRELVSTIEAMGCTVWWDRKIGAGTAFDREIERALDEAHCIVVVWSHISVEKEWVRTEAHEGLERGNLIPVAIEPVKPPLAFRRIQTIDLTMPEANASLITAIAKLLPASASVDSLPCVGRTAELERIGQQIERTKLGAGAFLLFSGEAGVGKTRLCAEAGRLAEANNFLVLRGHCLDMDMAAPYQPLLDQIEQGTRMLSPEQLRESLGENATELAKLMPQLRQQYADIPPYPTLPPEQERRYLLHGIGEFIGRAAANRPLMLIFEDLHWADESTSILLRYLAERLQGAPVLIVGTFRDGDLPAGSPFNRVLQELMRERLAEELPLKRLTRPQIVELLVRRFVAQPPAALVDLLNSETEGNPFFIAEVIRHLQDTGKLLTEAGKFRDGIEIADTEVPRGVRRIIEDRVGRVSAMCREILTIAAVAGRQFTFDLLLNADANHTEDDALDAVEEAQSTRLIEDISADRVAQYQFVHEQIRQTLLSGLSLPRRQRLHLRIADAFEATYRGNTDKYASEIGHHLYQAGSSADPSRAAQALSRAGERANDALAFEDALRQFDLALTVLTDGADGAVQARLHTLRSIALHGAGRIPESLDALSAAIALAPTEQSKDDYLLQRCRMLLDIWRGKDAIEDLEQLLARARERGVAPQELAVQQSVARGYYVMSLDTTGFADKTKQAYERTIELARKLGDNQTLARALIATAQLVDYWPEFATQAEANVDEASRIARATGDEDLDLAAATARLSVFLNPGSDLEGEVITKRLIERRDLVRLNAHYFQMMWATQSSGRFERSVEICDAGIALAHRIGAPPVQYPTIKALALIELGRFGDAAQALELEVADAAHPFGAALRDFGKLEYEINVGAFEAALERAPHIIAEAKGLHRAWMLQLICDTLSEIAPYYSDDAQMVGRIESLIATTGSPLRPNGRAAMALAHNDPALAAQTLLETPRASRTRNKITARLTAVRLLADACRISGHWPQAREHIEAGVELAREKHMRGQLFRLLAVQAMINRGLGMDERAAAARAEARSLQIEIAATIPDAQHRTTFLSGRLAQRLGLVD